MKLKVKGYKPRKKALTLQAVLPALALPRSGSRVKDRLALLSAGFLQLPGQRLNFKISTFVSYLKKIQIFGKS
jgi:hypothetical protein